MKYFLQNQQTKDLIEEIKLEVGGIPPTSIIRSIGSYVAKELVYAYAMWISPSFSLKVIRAYDSIVTEQTPLPTLDSLIPQDDTIQTLEGLIYRSIKEPFAVRAFIAIENGKACFVKQLLPSEIIFDVDKLDGLFDATAVLSKDQGISIARMASRQSKK